MLNAPYANSVNPSYLKTCINLLTAILLCIIPLSAAAVDSMSNKVTSVQTVGNLLRVGVATGIYHTRGSPIQGRNIDPTCSNDTAVVIRLDAVTPVELIEQVLIIQAVEAAKIGPFRIKFAILQGECELVGSDTFPVAIGVKLIHTENPP